jgi:hypothetical protein
MEQNIFLPFVPKFSAAFLPPPKFSRGVKEKFFSTSWARPSVYKPDTLPMHHLHRCCCDFPPVSVVTVQDFRAVSVITGREFLAISVVTVQDFRAVSVITGREFLAISVVTGRGIFRPYL